MGKFRFNEFGIGYYASDFGVKVRVAPVPEKSLVNIYVTGRRTNREDFITFVNANVRPDGIKYVYHKDTLYKRYKNWRNKK